MKVYELIKEYPGSPKLGTLISAMNSEMFSVKPHQYPDLWKCSETDKFLINPKGERFYLGEDAWSVFEKTNLQPYQTKITEADIAFQNRPLFKNDKEAIDYRNLLICFTTEDGAVIGENIPIYCVLAKGNWEESETRSLRIYVKNLTKLSSGEDFWKYFRSETAMEEYIRFNKPRYSLKDIKAMLSEILPKEMLELAVEHINAY